MATFEASFCAAEEEALRFLVAEHGFRVVVRHVTRVSSQYGVFGHVVYQASESSQGRGRAVSLQIAPLRLELDLLVSKHTSGPYTVEELHALDGKGIFPRREHGLYDTMHNPDQLLAEFTRLAGVLRASGSRFFNDESALWDDLRARREGRAEVEEIKRTLTLSRELFRARDWAGVVGLLSPIEDRLGTTASARLAHARKKARAGT